MVSILIEDIQWKGSFSKNDDFKPEIKVLTIYKNTEFIRFSTIDKFLN